MDSATQKLRKALEADLPEILRSLEQAILVVCVVPRAKNEREYSRDQQLFRTTVQAVARQSHGLIDGTDYLCRHTNTKTTHLGNKISNNDGRDPYPGITEHTCEVSSDVEGKDILLVDDIYTPDVNIDEDAIQALLRVGARSVTFYAIGRVIR
ncbi:MAG: amidophosphoribosyltransferase [bacterium]